MRATAVKVREYSDDIDTEITPSYVECEVVSNHVTLFTGDLVDCLQFAKDISTPLKVVTYRTVEKKDKKSGEVKTEIVTVVLAERGIAKWE